MCWHNRVKVAVCDVFSIPTMILSACTVENGFGRIPGFEGVRVDVTFKVDPCCFSVSLLSHLLGLDCSKLSTLEFATNQLVAIEFT